MGFGASNINSGFSRPTHQPNGWVPNWEANGEQSLINKIPRRFASGSEKYVIPNWFRNLNNRILGFDLQVKMEPAKYSAGLPRRLLVPRNSLLEWNEPKTVKQLVLMFDTDFDHPMESTLRGQPERVMPFCINRYKIYDGDDNLLYERKDNHQTINQIEFEESVQTKQLRIQVERPNSNVDAAI